MGGLNLLLAFNGVCKLYLRGKERTERVKHVTYGRLRSIEKWKREKRVEWMRAVKIDGENKTREKGETREEPKGGRK